MRHTVLQVKYYYVVWDTVTERIKFTRDNREECQAEADYLNGLNKEQDD